MIFLKSLVRVFKMQLQVYEKKQVLKIKVQENVLLRNYGFA